jgi:hypothetical protein
MGLTSQIAGVHSARRIRIGHCKFNERSMKLAAESKGTELGWQMLS